MDTLDKLFVLPSVESSIKTSPKKLMIASSLHEKSDKQIMKCHQFFSSFQEIKFEWRIKSKSVRNFKCAIFWYPIFFFKIVIKNVWLVIEFLKEQNIFNAAVNPKLHLTSYYNFNFCNNIEIIRIQFLSFAWEFDMKLSMKVIFLTLFIVTIQIYALIKFDKTVKKFLFLVLS